MSKISCIMYRQDVEGHDAIHYLFSLSRMGNLDFFIYQTFPVLLSISVLDITLLFRPHGVVK